LAGVKSGNDRNKQHGKKRRCVRECVRKRERERERESGAGGDVLRRVAAR
jgi:hypothetical protein